VATSTLVVSVPIIAYHRPGDGLGDNIINSAMEIKATEGANSNYIFPKVAHDGDDEKVAAANILLIIQPTTVDTRNYPDRVRAILDTYANPALHPQLAAVFVLPFQNSSFPNVSAVKFVANTSDKTIQLVRAVRAFAQSGYNWFFKIDEITFVRPSALLKFLVSRDVVKDEPIFIGKRLGLGKSSQGGIFCSGGAGFVFNKAAALALLKSWDSTCEKKMSKNAFYLRSEDVAFAECLAKAGVFPRVLKGEEDRFHALEIGGMVLEKDHGWLSDYSRAAGEPMKPSLECCHAESISFHYCEANLIRLLYSCLELKNKCFANATDLLQNWPSKLGGYATKPRSVEQATTVLALMNKLKE